MTVKLKNQIQKASQNPGVYLFKNKAGKILYIGKAVNLKNRLKQYLRIKAYVPFSGHLSKEAEKLDTKTTDSEIEALILESSLIKKHRPKYNIRLRDDKQYFFVGFTKEEFPKIFLTHRPQTEYQYIEVSNFIGPFTDGTALKITLRLLRRAFPYCTCKQKHHNFCLNYHIGKCLGYCCLKIKNQNVKIKITTQNLKIYKKNIKAIKGILTGKKNSIIKELKKELDQLVEKQDFEKAIELRNKVKKLERVFENAKIINRQANDANALIELKKIFKLSDAPRRIEGFDISNIQGKNAVGVMIVFTDGQPDKNEYRKFKIRFKKEPNDIAMLKEILTRRFCHPEWPYPDLIFIDGGKGQLNAAKKTTTGAAIISLAKGKNEVFSDILKNPVPIKRLPAPVQNLIKQIDSEAHRFAISYYRKIHRKMLIA
ncbi:MAG: GIY-YIG nuclease family protein [Patescibacteria group bacterium]